MIKNSLIIFPVFTILIGCNVDNFTNEEFPNVSVQCDEQLTYLSDTDPAYKYLELEQKKIYESFPGIADPFSKVVLESPNSVTRFNDLIERLSSTGCDEQGHNCLVDKELGTHLLRRFQCDPLSTKYESPMFQFAIQLNINNAIKRNPQLERLRSKIRFGSLPSGKVNGTAMLPPESKDPLIIIDRDIYSFTGAFSKSISDAIPISIDGGFVELIHDVTSIEKRIADNPEILANFSEAMIGMIKNGTSRGAKERELSANHYRLHTRLVSSMDQFLVNHEIAHVVLGHTESGAKRLLPINAYVWVNTDTGAEFLPLSEEVTSIQWEENDELEADMKAIELMLASVDDDVIGDLISVAAAYVIFELLESVDKYRIQTGRSQSKIGEHPPAHIRKEAVNKKVDEIRASNELLKINADFRPIISASLTTLLRLSDPIIRQELDIGPNSSFPKKHQLKYNQFITVE